jgi:hypothetical protein
MINVRRLGLMILSIGLGIAPVEGLILFRRSLIRRAPFMIFNI